MLYPSLNLPLFAQKVRREREQPQNDGLLSHY